MQIDLRRIDVGVAAATTVGMVVEAWLDPSSADHHQIVAPLLWLPITLAVAVRRRHPLAAGVVAAVMASVAQTLYPSPLIFGAIAWMCDMYAFTVWTRATTFWCGLAVYAVGTSATTIVRGSAAFSIISTIVMALVRLVLVRDRERRALLVERERALAAREAVVEERARIARELHDAIAHDVSMMVMHAGAERRMLDDAQHSTRDVLQAVEQIGRGALTEMRRLVGMLRTDGDDLLTPQPSLRDLDRLIGQVREAGLPVDLSIEGEQRELPMGLELSAYRIVQEALTNSLKHGGGTHATVQIRYRDESLELEIVDDGAGSSSGVPSGGHGLVGMRERVDMYGGLFEAGRQAAGGFTVHVLLPIR
jgi:signal transduction histidine kinase